MSERLNYKQVAKLYRTRSGNVARLAAEGVIPYHRIEHYVHADGTPGERYVFLETILLADLRRRGEIHAERAS